jgi:hypothetical protein
MIAVLTCRQTFPMKQFGRPSISSSALGLLEEVRANGTIVRRHPP